MKRRTLLQSAPLLFLPAPALAAAKPGRFDPVAWFEPTPTDILVDHPGYSPVRYPVSVPNPTASATLYIGEEGTSIRTIGSRPGGVTISLAPWLGPTHSEDGTPIRRPITDIPCRLAGLIESLPFAWTHDGGRRVTTIDSAEAGRIAASSRLSRFFAYRSRKEHYLAVADGPVGPLFERDGLYGALLFADRCRLYQVES